MNQIETDVLVNGDGTAGQSFALETALHGQVVLVTGTERATTGPCVRDGITTGADWEGRPELHERDTLVAGAIPVRPTELYPPEGRTTLMLGAVGEEAVLLRRSDNERLLDGVPSRRSPNPCDIVAREIGTELEPTGAAHVLPVLPRFRQTDSVIVYSIYRSNARFANSTVMRLGCPRRRLVDGAIPFPGRRIPARSRPLRRISPAGQSRPGPAVRPRVREAAGPVRGDTRPNGAKAVPLGYGTEVAGAYARPRLDGSSSEPRYLIETALQVVRSARGRRESRGLHVDVDHPNRDIERFLRGTLQVAEAR